jgi:hypothetical protein
MASPRDDDDSHDVVPSTRLVSSFLELGELLDAADCSDPLQSTQQLRVELDSQPFLLLSSHQPLSTMQGKPRDICRPQ